MANYVVNGGLGITTAALSSIVTYIGLGTGTTAPAKTDSALTTAITDSGLEAGAATVTQQTTTTANDTLRLVKVFTVTGSKAIAECVATKSDGTVFFHGLTNAVKNVSNGDSYTQTINIACVG